ncbi:hypothetical protein HL42_5142 [Trichophyton rubrum]|nr:hypothetical protein HL42_5142 [Trichophyton rubrum]
MLFSPLTKLYQSAVVLFSPLGHVSIATTQQHSSLNAQPPSHRYLLLLLLPPPPPTLPLFSSLSSLSVQITAYNLGINAAFDCLVQQAGFDIASTSSNQHSERREPEQKQRASSHPPATSPIYQSVCEASLTKE